MAALASSPGRLGVRGRIARLSLRARLLVGLIAVVLVGLVAVNAIVYAKIDSYLVGQIDGELSTAQNQLLNALSRPGFIDQSNPDFFSASTPAGTYGALLSASGSTVRSVGKVESGHVPVVPQATVATALRLGSDSATSAPPVYATTGSLNDGDFEYRLLAVPVAYSLDDGPSEPGVAVVAIPIADLNGILHKLVVLDAIVGLALVLVLGGIGYVVVRLGLRPLAEIEETAGAIAAGDLTRRVEREDETSEVGRLGASLNVMLGTIEQSFEDQQASEARLRQFLADASHELRTPVTSIRGYAELFRRGAAERPEDLASAMRRIEEEAIRMGVLVDDLLLLARLDQGRPLAFGAVDLAPLAADAVSDAEVIDPERPFSFEADGPLVVAGDEPRLRQVVANLLQNALRYSEPGTPIAVHASRSGSRAVLRVVDRGVGIAAEHLPHLFERFYRADPSRTRGSGGSGLGLAIVASIVEAHGGSVSVESELGVGSTFTVELPLAAAPSRPLARSDEPDQRAEPLDRPERLGDHEEITVDPYAAERDDRAAAGAGTARTARPDGP